MIRNIKKAFRLVPYAYNFKANLFMGGGFALCGIVLTLLSGADDFWGKYGGLLALAGGFFPVQMIYSLAVSEEVMTSPLRKTLLTKTAVFMNWLMFAGVYLLVALIRGIQCGGNRTLLTAACGELLLIAVFGMVVMLYGSMSLKYFWLPTIFFCFFYPVLNTTLGEDGIQLGSITTTYGQVVVVGLFILLIGAVLSYGITLLLYKKPISKMSQNAQLRQYM